MWSALGSEPINGTAARWVSEPNYRGTFSILSSCIITLSLCVWTAVHVNVPDPRHKKRVFWWKTGWLTLGILAPEFVALVAYQQRTEARQLTAEMRRLLERHMEERQPDSAKPSTTWYQRLIAFLPLRKKKRSNGNREADPEVASSEANRAASREENAEQDTRKRRHPWTATHSYLALMGGLVFDNTADPTQCPLPDRRNKVTITSRGLVQLTELAPELVPDISLEEIHDKSKTNDLAKLISCFQASWFCLQVVTRLAQHLPVTLLEINTFAHAFCALFIFALWWDKPLDIAEPFVLPVSAPPSHPAKLEIQRTAAICAAMCNYSKIGSQFYCWLTKRNGKPFKSRKNGILPVRGVIIDTRFANYLQMMVEQIYTGESGLDFYRSGEGGRFNNQVKLPRDLPLTISRAHVSWTNGDICPKFHSELIDGSKSTFAWNTKNRQQGVHVKPQLIFSVPMLSLFSALSDTVLQYPFALSNHMDIPSDYWDRTRLIYQEKSYLRLQAQQEEEEDGEDGEEAPTPIFSDKERRTILYHSLKGSSLVCDRSTNWIYHDGIRSNSTSPESPVGNGYLASLRFLALFAVASIAYSGWHLLAWAGPFRGHTAMVLWRGSGIGLGAAAVALVLCSLALMLFMTGHRDVGPWLIFFMTEHRDMGRWRTVLKAIIFGVMLLFALFLLFLIACRLSLVVESLIGLAYVPDGVFELPNWALYFPHIA